MHNYLEIRAVEEMATAFYKHPYGGIARSVTVTQAGAERFFELLPGALDRMIPAGFHGKVLDRLESDDHELLLYRGYNKDMLSVWTICIIDRTLDAKFKHMARAMRGGNNGHHEDQSGVRGDVSFAAAQRGCN